MKLQPRQPGVNRPQSPADASMLAASTASPGMQAQPLAAAGQRPKVMLARPGDIDSTKKTLEHARNLGFSQGAFQRGPHVDLSDPQHGDARAASFGVAPFAGGAGSAITSLESVSQSHPLYGRQLTQWLSEKKAEPSQGMVLEMIQDRLREMKDTVRSSR